ATLLLSQISPALVGKKMDSECVYDSVNLLLSYQSSDGSFPAWEPERAYRWLEYLNPTEFLADTIVEREYGRWGLCYTYAAWFGVEALVACGKSYKNSPILRKACEFLLSKQLPDGGWGESYLSSTNEVYTNLEGNRSNVVQTAWALLALIVAGQAEMNPTPIHHGVKLLINAQMDDGDFPQQEVNGIYMKNGVLNFSAYRNIFTIWAIGEYRRRVLFAY
ncbi:Squalene cyclase, C-terminal, partial [Parasponia andersonii]